MVRVGAEIDPSFNSTMDGASGKLGDFAGKAGDVGEAWAAATGKITDVIPGLKELGDSADKGTESVSRMAEGFKDLLGEVVALGAGLLALDTLKEVAVDALSVYGNVEKASISLTALTGSAGAAAGIIENLKGIAVADALSFPNLVTAAQRMTALGFSAADMYRTLQTAADTAAATGKSFDAVTNAIDRMVLSGTASSKMLATLGISTDALAKSMGVAASDVTTAFKALDESQRIQVINDALAKFGGVAGQVAQGILGQWQNLKTEWEFALESMGAALAPLASQLMSDLGPALQTAVKGFGDLFSAIGPLVGGVVGALGQGLADIFTVVGSVASAIGSLVNVMLNFDPITAHAGFTWKGLLEQMQAINPLHAVAVEIQLMTTYMDMWVQRAQLMGQRFDGVTASLKSFIDTSTAKTGLLGIRTDMDGLNQNLVDAQNRLALVKTALEQGMAVQGQYAAALQAVQKAQEALTPGYIDAIKFNESFAASAQKAMDSLSGVTSGDISAQQALSKLNSVIEDGSTHFDTLSASGVDALLKVMAAANQMRQAMVDAENNDAIDKIIHKLSDMETAAGRLADKVPKDFSDMMAGVTQGVNFSGLEKSLQTTIDNLKANLATVGPDFKFGLQVAIDKAQEAKNGLEQMTAALALIGQDKSMELLAAHIDGLIAVQNKGQLSDEQWQAGLNGVADALQKKIIPAMEQGVPISQALVAELAKIPGIGPQLAAAAGQGFDAFNNAVKAWAESTRASVLSVDQAFADLGVKSLDTTTQSVKRSGDDITAVLKGVADASSLTSAQFTVDQAAIIAWGNNVLPAMQNFGISVNDDVLAQVAKIAPALAEAAKNGPDAFAAALLRLKTQATDSTMSLEDAFKDLGMKSAQDLNDAATAAAAAFNKILASGTASANQLVNSEIVKWQKIKDLAIAGGGDLTADQQQTLDKLLNQQSYFNQQHEDQWHALYTSVDNQIMGLSTKLVQDLFEGNGSFGKTALKALEDLGAAVVSAFIAPATKAIANFIAGSLSDLMGKLGALVGAQGFGGVQNVVGVALPDALSGLEDAFGDLGDTAIKAASDIDEALGGVSSAGAGGVSGAVGAVGAVTGSIMSSISSIMGMVTGVISAITGIIQVVQGFSMENALKAIEKETARMAIYLGDQGGNSIQGLMWRLVNDIEFGEMEKALNIISADIDKVAGPFWAYGLDNLKAISSNTYWALQKLQEIDNKTGNTSGSVNVEGTDLSTVISALDIINNTLVAESQTIPWFQTALQNINNGVVACAGWLQGILNLFQSGAAKVGGATAGSQPMADLAKFVGANFTDLENWLFSAFGRSMALPALPSPEQIPSSLAGGTAAASSATGSSTAAASTSTTAHAQQSTAGPTTAAPVPDIIPFLTAQFTTTDGILSKAGDGMVAMMTGANVMLASLGAGVRQVDASLEKIGVGILAAFGSVTASLKTAQELVSANENKILDQIVILNGRESQELSLMGLVRDAVGQFATMTANQLSELINVTKMIISVPASTTSAAFAGAAGAVSQIASSGGGHTFNFPNARITGTNEARQALDQAVNELRRRNRII